MSPDELSAVDAWRLRRLAEAASDVSEGRLKTRAGLEAVLSALMTSVRPDGSAAGARDLLEAVLLFTDHRCGVQNIANTIAEVVQMPQVAA